MKVARLILVFATSYSFMTTSTSFTTFMISPRLSWPSNKGAYCNVSTSLQFIPSQGCQLLAASEVWFIQQHHGDHRSRCRNITGFSSSTTVARCRRISFKCRLFHWRTRTGNSPTKFMEFTPTTSTRRERSNYNICHWIMDRICTLSARGLYDDDNTEEKELVGGTTGITGMVGYEHELLQSGIQMNIILFLVCYAYKCYRSVVINKLAIWERQPQWDTLISSKEEDETSNLYAMSCKECGSTLFIAKGRKWFQMPRGYKCYCCGATGEDNFTNIRKELITNLEDDYFDYEKPLDFVKRGERRRLLQQMGSDEKKVNDVLLSERNMKRIDEIVDEDDNKEDLNEVTLTKNKIEGTSIQKLEATTTKE